MLKTQKQSNNFNYDPVISNLDFIVQRIKHEEPDLPNLIIQTQKHGGADTYLKSFRFDNTPAEEIEQLRHETDLRLEVMDQFEHLSTGND